MGTETASRMHDDELTADAELVRRLVAEQLPELVGLSVRPVGRGTVNAMFRLGDDLVVRLPRTATWAGDLDRERAWLPVLRERLTLQVPEPVAQGRPTAEYRCRGRSTGGSRVTSTPTGSWPTRPSPPWSWPGSSVSCAPPRWTTFRRPLAELDAATRAAIVEAGALLDTRAVLAAWDRALAAPPFAGDRVWVHTDLLRPNLLVQDGRLAAVIDFGAVGAGDPAADVIPAWTVFGAAGRARYRESLEVDDATWDRARGYALTQAALIVPYYRETNPAFTASAVRTIGEILADRGALHT